jgi:hypothetical protein
MGVLVKSLTRNVISHTPAAGFQRASPLQTTAAFIKTTKTHGISFRANRNTILINTDKRQILKIPLALRI